MSTTSTPQRRIGDPLKKDGILQELVEQTARKIVYYLHINDRFVARANMMQVVKMRNNGITVLRAVLKYLMDDIGVGTLINFRTNDPLIPGAYKYDIINSKAVTLDAFVRILIDFNRDGILPIKKIFTLSKISVQNLLLEPETLKYLIDSGVVVFSNTVKIFNNGNGSHILGGENGSFGKDTHYRTVINFITCVNANLCNRNRYHFPEEFIIDEITLGFKFSLNIVQNSIYILKYFTNDVAFTLKTKVLMDYILGELTYITNLTYEEYKERYEYTQNIGLVRGMSVLTGAGVSIRNEKEFGYIKGNTINFAMELFAEFQDIIVQKTNSLMLSETGNTWSELQNCNTALEFLFKDREVKDVNTDE